MESCGLGKTSGGSIPSLSAKFIVYQKMETGKANHEINRNLIDDFKSKWYKIVETVINIKDNVIDATSSSTSGSLSN